MVIEYVYPNLSKNLYLYIKRAISVGDNELQKVEKYIGKYRYFRRNIQGNFVDGMINIYNGDGIILFDHSNNFSDNLNDIKINHTGFVYIMGERMYLIGIGDRYIRPIIANCVKDPLKERIDGIVMSTREGDGVLFCAKFIMFNEKSDEYQMWKNFSLLDVEDNESFEFFIDKLAQDIEETNLHGGVITSVGFR